MPYRQVRSDDLAIGQEVVWFHQGRPFEGEILGTLTDRLFIIRWDYMMHPQTYHKDLLLRNAFIAIDPIDLLMEVVGEAHNEPDGLTMPAKTC